MGLEIRVKNRGMIIPEEVLEATRRDELIARLFINRGYDKPDVIRQMLGTEPYHETSTDEFLHIESAVKRIDEAIRLGQKICVYGDYDVDGVTATVVLVETLKNFTDSVVYHVPHRFSEGYGMNSQVVESLSHAGVALIITCDCGISNVEEVKTAKRLGMDVIVTDHHNIPDALPVADVILNPKLLNKEHPAYNISGCAMAYFLSRAILAHYGKEEQAQDLLDMVGLSLVADVVPLDRENRYLLKRALPKIFDSKRVGLIELINVAGKGQRLCTEEDIAFQLAPRVNAAGRMDSARLPVELFLCKDEAKARELASRMDFLNMERKKIQGSMLQEAEDMLESAMNKSPVCVLYKEDWHHGVIGIAAGRLCEKYQKPIIMMAAKEEKDIAVGSARSVEGIDIYELIKGSSGKLIKFGGHPMAAGLSLSINDVAEFSEEINDFAKGMRITDKILEGPEVDAELELSEIDPMLYNRLLIAGPYGEGFAPPVFASKSLYVLSDRKTDKNHHIMVLADDKDFRVSAVKWFGEDFSLQGKMFDVAYTVGLNSFNKNVNIQLVLNFMQEKSENIGVSYRKPIIIDRRNISLKSVIEEYKNADVFFEGLEMERPKCQKIVDRYSVVKTEIIVFASMPASGALFREVVASAGSTNIVVNLSILPDYSLSGFMAKLVKLLKYAVNNLGGKVNVEELATKLCIEQPIVYAALKYLNAAGKLLYLFDYDSGWAYIQTQNSEADKATLAFAEKGLKNALAEKESYKQFIYKMDIKQWGELCNEQRN